MKHVRWTAVMVVALFAVGFIVGGCSLLQNPWERAGTEPGQEIVGPDGGTMVWVPAGEFPMGTTEEQAAEWLQTWPEAMRDQLEFWFEAETPQRRVEMDGFWLHKHEVTNAQYRAFCEATGREFPSKSTEGDDHPVVYVNWDDAVAYAEHYGLSLPSEAQWEYAARGPEGRIFPWGDDWDDQKCCNVINHGDGDIPTMEVGSIPEGASWCGALDMAGNVWEWCADWYDPNYYKTGPTRNPAGPSNAVEFDWVFLGLTGVVSGARVLRGGSWYLDLAVDDSYRCAYRNRRNPESRRYYNGFRCARTVP
ncbi:MAG: formylglycine-generating enzyme family protein [Armatimonadota bacterium]